MSGIEGRWRIVESDVWDQETLDLVGPSFIELTRTGGSFRMIAMEGDIDPRPTDRREGPAVEFSWDGVDEMDQANGRGWAALDPDGRLRGHIYVHRGEDSSFLAQPFVD